MIQLYLNADSPTRSYLYWIPLTFCLMHAHRLAWTANISATYEATQTVRVRYELGMRWPGHRLWPER